VSTVRAPAEMERNWDMRYTDFMVVGIDYGVLLCEGCGALVPFDRRELHDAFHAAVEPVSIGA
jgi:hypothetical protein